MKAQLVSAVALLRREARRQTSARVAHRNARPPQGHTRLVRRRVPVVARVDPMLLLERQRLELAAALTAELLRRGVAYCWLPQPEGRSRILSLRQEDHDVLLEALAAIAGPAWYADVLSREGVPVGSLLPVADLRGGPAASARGLLVWEYVVPGPGATFVAEEGQGLSIFFWRVEPETGDRVSRVANLTATRLPPDAFAGSGFVPAPLRSRPATAVGFPVDVVYTWVDGEDADWLHSKAEAAQVADEALFTERAHDDSRFADHDELRYSLRALEQYAPWVNHVWIVTADQHPSWLQRDHPWVSVVSHRDIWPDEVGLPTFNSHAIEASLHRIPGLAEHFLYLNDDMLFARPLGPESFFHPSGIGSFFSSRALVDFAESRTGDIASTTAARNARRLIEDRYGVTFTRKFFHTASALSVSGLTALEEEFPDVVARTRQAAFRTLDDVAVAGSFYLNWAYVTGRVVPGRLRYSYIDPGAPDAAHRLQQLSRKRVFDTICVNDGSTEQTLDERRHADALTRSFFADYLPVPGTFEV